MPADVTTVVAAVATTVAVATITNAAAAAITGAQSAVALTFHLWPLAIAISDSLSLAAAPDLPLPAVA